MDFEIEDQAPKAPSASDSMKAKLLDELIEKIMMSEDAPPEEPMAEEKMPMENPEEDKLAALAGV